MKVIGRRKFLIVAMAIFAAFGVTIATGSTPWWTGLDPELAKLWLRLTEALGLVVLGVYAGQGRKPGITPGNDPDENNNPK